MNEASSMTDKPSREDVLWMAGEPVSHAHINPNGKICDVFLEPGSLYESDLRSGWTEMPLYTESQLLAIYAAGAEAMRERAAKECVAVNIKRTNAGWTNGYNAIMACHDAILDLPITQTNTEGEQ